MSLAFISQQLTIYGGLFFYIGGIIGNGINVLVFSSVRTYRTTPCTFYFLIGSMLSIVFLASNLTSRIVSVGFGFDLSRTSSSWCKIRQYSVVTLGLIILNCSCLATIDQFFCTSQSAYVRGFSNIKWARRIVLIISIIWSLHEIPLLFFQNISPITKTCAITDAIYAIYFSVYYLGLFCVIPVSIMIGFSYLTYRNIHQTRVLIEQQADRQLARMTFIQVVLVVISLVPYGVIFAYNLITSGISKDGDRLARESFAFTTLTLVTYLYYTGSCYTFLISSSRFRRATKNRILFLLRSHRVIPFQQETLGRGTLEMKTYN